MRRCGRPYWLGRLVALLKSSYSFLYLYHSYSCIDSFISLGSRLLTAFSRSLYRADSRLRLRPHFSLLKRPAGFGVFSQFTGHYLYRESKRAIIYAQNEVIGLTGKRKPQSMTIMGDPGVRSRGFRRTFAHDDKRTPPRPVSYWLKAPAHALQSTYEAAGNPTPTFDTNCSS